MKTSRKKKKCIKVPFFSASEGWFRGFKNHWIFYYVNQVGEAISVDEKAMKIYLLI